MPVWARTLGRWLGLWAWLCLGHPLAFADLNSVSATASPVRVLKVPRHTAEVDPEIQYLTDLLHQALSRGNLPVQIQLTEHGMTQARALEEVGLRRGQVDVAWAMTSEALEARLQPIRIPLFRGLIGWRIPLVHGDTAHLFEKVEHKDLTHLRPGQMPFWPDTAVLAGNGIDVVTSSNYKSLFQMLAFKRIDYFPRSVTEVQRELAAHPELPLALDPHVVIHYPAAFYFFVHPQDRELADALRSGLESMVDDGSLRDTFDAHFGSELDRLNLPSRRVLRLNNPQLPAATPTERPELWFSLTTDESP
ncbi:MAG: transporter substrate-binding domain-containing protein [Gammaproteobacteria bacterium]|nr:transporter substrate-binding domain-containing protein [Gammaproteobacteria bacterium]